jgi:serine/threonine-protein kinase
MRMGCPRCGSFYDADAKFCARDGAKLISAGLAPSPIAGTPSVPTGATTIAPDAPTPAPARPRARGTRETKAKGGAAGAAGSARKAARPSTSKRARSSTAKGGRGATAPPAASSAGNTASEAPGATPASTTSRPSPNGSASGAVWLDYANLAGSVLDSRYLVQRKIADGGMSMVYLAQDQQNAGAKVAIKILPPELSEDMKSLERLRREADMGIRLTHPNVCTILRLGQTPDGLQYVVMPYVDGEVLCDRTFRVGAIPLPLAVRLVRDIAAGLHAAHELEIIHRDLKPENVMICTAPDGEEFAVVMDFGLAQDRDAARFLEKLTATGIVLGTPEFMSPEQLRGKPLDRRTDIYSLGLLACEMLTGKLPFEGENQQDLLLARLRSHPTPIRQMRPDLNFPAELEKVMIKALQRVPEERFATTLEFAAAFEKAATSAPASLLGRVLGG